MTKFYAWLENNKYAPIKLKIQILYTCVFPAILYGAETWWDINNNLMEDILLLERAVLKRCLGVKKSTPTDIVYCELNRPDMSAVIKDSQRNFFKKLQNLSSEDALVTDVMSLCRNTSLDIQGRKNRVRESEKTLTKRYYNITNGEYCHTIYDWNVLEENRTLLTRWRLSNFDLAIQTSRYGQANQVDGDKCSTCHTVEDEFHVLFACSLYINIRLKFAELLVDYPTTEKILNPRTPEDANRIGRYLKAIENTRKHVLLPS